MTYNLKALNWIYAHMSNPDNWGAEGICALYQEYLLAENDPDVDDARYYLEYEFQNWPKFSGEWQYPVPSTDQFTRQGAHVAFAEATPEQMWDRQNSEYAALRWELLEWLIKRAEDQGQ